MLIRSCLAVLCCALVTPLAQAQEPPKPAVPPAEEWHTVAKGPIKLEMELDGVLEASQMWPVEVKLKAWQSQGLKVVDPIEQGRAVHKGDTLVTFDTEEIDRALRDAELAHEGAKVGLENAKHDLALLERSVAIDLTVAERGLQYAKFDIDYFTKISRPMQEKSSSDRLKSTRFNLEYTREELKQLKQMYKEDELTEETEEIILLRQERMVEFANNMVEQNEEQHEQFMKTTMPRRHKEVEVGLEKTQIENDRAKATLPLRLQGSRQGLARAEYAFQDSDKRLKELRADRAVLVVRAPADGVVFYGKCERGRWSDVATVAAGMKPEGSLRPNSVLLTIVSPRPAFVRSEVGEANVLRIRDGLTGWITPTATPYDPVKVTVRSVGKLPIGPGQYDVVADLDGDAPALTPGMTGKLKFVTYEKTDAVKVPLAAVKSDTPGKHHVFIKTDQGPQKRDVKLGQRTATEAEVLDGLKEGDQINPKGETKDQTK